MINKPRPVSQSKSVHHGDEAAPPLLVMVVNVQAKRHLKLYARFFQARLDSFCVLCGLCTLFLFEQIRQQVYFI